MPTTTTVGYVTEKTVCLNCYSSVHYNAKDLTIHLVLRCWPFPIFVVGGRVWHTAIGELILAAPHMGYSNMMWRNRIASTWNTRVLETRDLHYLWIRAISLACIEASYPYTGVDLGLKEGGPDWRGSGVGTKNRWGGGNCACCNVQLLGCSEGEGAGGGCAPSCVKHESPVHFKILDA